MQDEGSSGRSPGLPRVLSGLLVAALGPPALAVGAFAAAAAFGGYLRGGSVGAYPMVAMAMATASLGAALGLAWVAYGHRSAGAGWRASAAAGAVGAAAFAALVAVAIHALWAGGTRLGPALIGGIYAAAVGAFSGTLFWSVAGRRRSRA